MPIYVATLQSEELDNRMIKLKQEASRIAKDSLYIGDRPHITMYVAELRNILEWVDKFPIESIRGLLKKLEVTGWLVFKKDLVTGKDTLTCNVAGENLQRIQQIVVLFLNQHRTAGTIERFTRFTARGAMKKNLQRYGYPFVGKTWKPHVSIASLEKDSFEKVWSELKDRCPKGVYSPTKICIYELTGKEELLEKKAFKV